VFFRIEFNYVLGRQQYVTIPVLQYTKYKFVSVYHDLRPFLPTNKGQKCFSRQLR